MSPRHDVAIVGGGPAGCAAAIELRRLGVERVAVLDAGARPLPVGETLPPDTRALIDRLGIGDDFAAAGHVRCPGSRSAWGDDRLAGDDFVVHPGGHGWHLDRRRFDEMLARRVAAVGATFAVGRVRAVERRRAGGFRVDAGPSSVDAEVVVDASGATALVARRLGARRLVHDRLSCTVGFLRLAPGSAMPAVTFVEAVRDGWWYAARLPDERAVALLACEPSAVTAGLRTIDGWRAALAATVHVAPALAAAEPVELGLRTAPSSLTEPAAGDGWLAVGDAATCFDPLASQGIHQALADGLRAGTAVAAWFGGDGTGLGRHATAVRRRFAEYLAIRDDLYRRERRWPDAPFWAARRAARSPLPTRSV